MSGKWVWVDQNAQSRKRKAGSKRQKGIKTTHREPPLIRKLRATKKGVTRSAKTVLMLVGIATVLILIFRML